MSNDLGDERYKCMICGKIERPLHGNRCDDCVPETTPLWIAPIPWADFTGDIEGHPEYEPIGDLFFYLGGTHTIVGTSAPQTFPINYRPALMPNYGFDPNAKFYLGGTGTFAGIGAKKCGLYDD